MTRYSKLGGLIAANHRTMNTMPDSPDPCLRYQGCDSGYPIDFCETSGRQHDRQDSLAPMRSGIL